MDINLTKYELLWALNTELETATNSYVREMADVIDDDFFKQAFEEDETLDKIIVESTVVDESGSLVAIEIFGEVNGKKLNSSKIPELSYMESALNKLNNKVLYKRFGVEQEYVFVRCLQ